MYVEKDVNAPFVKQKGRMDLIFRDARNPQYAFIDVVIPTGWAPNDANADRQLGYPLRNLKRRRMQQRQCNGLMPIAISDT